MLLTLRYMLLSALPMVVAAQNPQKPPMEPIGPMKLDFDLHIDPFAFRTHELEVRAEALANIDMERLAERAHEIEMRSDEIKMRAEEAAQRVAMLDFDRGLKFSPQFDFKFDFNERINTTINAKSDRLLTGKPLA